MSLLKQKLMEFRSDPSKIAKQPVKEKDKKPKAKKEAKPPAPRKGSKQAAPPPVKQASAATVLSSAVAPLGKRKKDVLDCLLQQDGKVTFQEIFLITNIKIDEDRELYEALQSHDNVEFLGDALRYKSSHQFKNKVELLQHLRRAPDGTVAMEIKDAYKTVLQDIDELKAEGEVYIIHNAEHKYDVVYPYDKVMPNLKVDDDIIDLWRKTQAPKELPDLQLALHKAGIKSVTASLPKRRIAEADRSGKKARKQTHNIRKVTNIHLPELFTGAQPVQID